MSRAAARERPEAAPGSWHSAAGGPLEQRQGWLPRHHKKGAKEKERERPSATHLRGRRRQWQLHPGPRCRQSRAARPAPGRRGQRGPRRRRRAVSRRAGRGRRCVASRPGCPGRTRGLQQGPRAAAASALPSLFRGLCCSPGRLHCRQRSTGGSQRVEASPLPPTCPDGGALKVGAPGPHRRLKIGAAGADGRIVVGPACTDRGVGAPAAALHKAAGWDRESWGTMRKGIGRGSELSGAAF